MILENPIFTEMILPFLLVFVVVFAILQKSKILGDGKEQIDAMVSLAVALILIVAPQPRSIVVGLMPWMAVGVAVILVFLILYGFVAGDLSGENMSSKIKNTFLVLAALFTAGIVIYVSGLWKVLFDWVSGSGGGDLWGSLIIIVVVIGAVVWVINSSGKKEDSN